MRRSHLITLAAMAALVGAGGAGRAASELPMVAVQVETPPPGAAPSAAEQPAEAEPGAEAGVDSGADAPAEPFAEPDLDSLRWIARPIVVFADSENDPRFRQQMDLLELYTDDLLARDVVVLTDTDAGVLSDLRRELRPRDFTLVLIDKDGTVVQRRPAPTTVRELTHTIDRLPSRRLESGSMRQ